MARKSRTHTVDFKVKQSDFKYNACIYKRLSVEDGDDIEQNSIINQQMLGEKFVSEHNDIRLISDFSDSGYSGMSYNRPGFKNMMSEIMSGKINCIIVKDISRLGRHFIETSEYVERIFPEYEIRLICINDNYDSLENSLDTLSVIMPFKMIMNDSYAKDISKKIRSSINTKIKSGEFLPSSGSVPYGYIRNGESLIYDIDSETEGIVRRIYELRANGAAFNAIAKILNSEGIPCPGKLRFLRGMTSAEKYKNAVWIRGTIRKILNDSVYIGNRTHGRYGRDKIGLPKVRREKDKLVVIENAHPPIITGELFETVQAVNERELEKRRLFEKRAEPDNDFRKMFKGKIYCGDCGSLMTAAKGCARPNAKTPSRIFFECNTYRYSGKTSCRCHYIRQESVMEAVSKSLDMQVKAALDIENLIHDIKNSEKTKFFKRNALSELKSVQAQKRNNEEKLDRVLDDLSQMVISRSEYEKLKLKYLGNISLLSEKEAALQSEVNQLSEAILSVDKWLSLLKRYKKIPKITRELVDILIDRILVYEDRKIEILFNFSNPYEQFEDYRERIEAV